MMKNNYEIGGIFPTPLYTAKRNPEYTTEEEKKDKHKENYFHDIPSTILNHNSCALTVFLAFPSAS